MRTIALLYHDVVPSGRFETSGFAGADADIYKLDAEEFRRHLETIAAHAAAPPTTSVDPAGPGNTANILITFDDGGAGAVCAAELLGEYGWRGYFFITTDRIDTPGFVTQAQLRGLNAAGHIVGSHSCSHPARMSHCTTAHLEREWRDSVRRLQDVLGAPVVCASVPGGYYDRRVAAVAAASGIRLLFNSEPTTRAFNVDGCTVLGRFSVQQGTPADWVGAVAAGALRPRAQLWLFWNAKKLLKSAGGNLWLKMRRELLARRARSAPR